MPVAPYPTFGAPLPGNYAGGVAPNQYGSARGGGFVRVGPGWQGKVRVGPGRPVPGRPAAAAPAAAPQLPAFPPTGTFNPSRELEVGEAKRGLEQAEGETAKTQQAYRNRYATGIGELGRQEGEENTGYQKGLGLLSEAFQKLGTTQSERANAAGVLQGGALLQAAAKRGTNEGKEREKEGEAHDKNIAAINRSRGKLGEELAPPDASNPLGGTLWQALTEHMANLSGNFAFYQQGQQGLAAQEAAERGFTGYRAPAAAARPTPRAPAGGARLWNAGQKRMMTYKNGRWY